MQTYIFKGFILRVAGRLYVLVSLYISDIYNLCPLHLKLLLAHFISDIFSNSQMQKTVEYAYYIKAILKCIWKSLIKSLILWNGSVHAAQLLSLMFIWLMKVTTWVLFQSILVLIIVIWKNAISLYPWTYSGISWLLWPTYLYPRIFSGISWLSWPTWRAG